MAKYKNGYWLVVLALDGFHRKYTKRGGFKTAKQKQEVLDLVKDAFEQKLISDVYECIMINKFMRRTVKND